MIFRFLRRQTNDKTSIARGTPIDDNTSSICKFPSCHCDNVTNKYKFGRWYLHRIIPNRRKNRQDNGISKNHPIDKQKKVSADSTTASDNDTTPMSNGGPVSNVEYEIPLQNYENTTNSCKPNNLSRDDSIITFLQKIDEAYENLMSNKLNNSNKGSIEEDDYFQNNKNNAYEQSISIITMDPALTYEHSIIIDDISTSFRSNYSYRDGEGKVAKMPWIEI